MEIWERIPEFPDYLVSDWGLVRNENTGRLLAMNMNQHGVLNVGLMRNGVQCKRSVPVLVARTFLPQPPARFDTPIHLNGNRYHAFVDNLRWRPRPFAIDYHKQMERPYKHRIDAPIELVETGERFEHSFAAAIKHGLLERAVVLSVLNDDMAVFPTGHHFRLIPE